MEKPVKKAKEFFIKAKTQEDGTIIACFIWIENGEKHGRQQEFKEIFELSNFLKASLTYLSTLSDDLA